MPSEESQGFKPGPGNLAVRDYRGASGNVSHGGTVNPSCNRKSRSGNPSPTAGRARFLSQWALVQVDVESGEGGEIGKPGNSAKCPEAADCITCESEGRTRVQVLSSVRQGVSRGCSELRLCQMQSQWRRSWGRRSDVRRHRGVWKSRSGVRGSQDPGYRNRLEPMARGTGARAQGQDLSTASGQTGLHSEAEQQENATSGDRDDPRSGCSDGGDAGA